MDAGSKTAWAFWKGKDITAFAAARRAIAGG